MTTTDWQQKLQQDQEAYHTWLDELAKQEEETYWQEQRDTYMTEMMTKQMEH